MLCSLSYELRERNTLKQTMCQRSMYYLIAVEFGKRSRLTHVKFQNSAVEHQKKLMWKCDSVAVINSDGVKIEMLTGT